MGKAKDLYIGFEKILFFNLVIGRRDGCEDFSS